MRLLVPCSLYIHDKSVAPRVGGSEHLNDSKARIQCRLGVLTPPQGTSVTFTPYPDIPQTQQLVRLQEVPFASLRDTMTLGTRRSFQTNSVSGPVGPWRHTPFLTATSHLHGGNEVPTTKEARRCSPLVEFSDWRLGLSETNSERGTNQGCFRLCQYSP